LVSTTSICSCCYVFFFSSRRRHTRFSRDWSSDVCSSDLTPIMHRATVANGIVYVGGTVADDTSLGMSEQTRSILTKIAGYLNERSEERRVGKECRSRWSQYH